MRYKFQKIANFLLRSREQWRHLPLVRGWWLLNALVNWVLTTRMRVFGDPRRIHVDQSVVLCNTLFNTVLGDIYIGEWTFCGQDVSILTGTHDAHLKGALRLRHTCHGNYDIRIGNGVWLCSNCTILGPCEIGDDAVIAAGAVITPRTVVPPRSIWGGVPAKQIGEIAAEDRTP
jgi:acetyltransferase-like isoleucine patch superfamily enzyme